MKRQQLSITALGGLLVTAGFVLVFSSRGLAQTNAVPLINQPLVPDAASPGSSDFTLTVNGAGFVSGSVVNWNGVALATTFIGAAQLSAAVPAEDVAEAGTSSVTVVSPAPGGGMSNAALFPVATPPSSVVLSPAGFSQNFALVQAASGDFNRDGKMDVVGIPGVPLGLLCILAMVTVHFSLRCFIPFRGETMKM